MQNAYTKRWTDPTDYDTLKVDTTVDARSGWEAPNYGEKSNIRSGFEAFPSGDPLKSSIKKVKPDGDFFDVAMHGSSNSLCFGTKKPSMDARELARIIMRDPNYRRKQGVRLLSCSTGQKRKNGEYCVAEHLANILGVEVKAPNDKLYINPDGTYYVGLLGEGEFVSFIPNQRRRLK